MSKVYKLAEIAAYHMDAVREGRVRWGRALLTLQAGRLAFVSEDGRCLGLELDGYTIEPKEPEVVNVPRKTGWRKDAWRRRMAEVPVEAHEALLAFVDAFDEWVHLHPSVLDPEHPIERGVLDARARFKVVD